MLGLPRGRSLRFRLAVWYGALTFIVVVLVCIYSFAVHSRAHYDELDAALSAAADHIAQEVEAAQTTGELASVLEASLHLGTVMRVYDSNGSLSLRSPGDSIAPALARNVLSSRPSVPAYPAIASLVPEMQHAESPRGRFHIIEGARRWRTYVVQLGSTGGHLAAILSLAHIDDSVRRFALLMGALALVGGLASFGFGYLVSARALRPISLLTADAAQIERTRELSRRVSVNPSGDELGRLAGTFNEMLASLEKSHAAQKRFVSDASHELRAPLTVIQANLELLRAGRAVAPGELQHAADEAYRETTRLARLVSDLLVLARADAGVSVQKVPVELDRIVMDVLGEARHLVNGQKLEVGALEPCTILGDPDRLRQLLLNLVTNAIKYTPDGGRVTIGLGRDNGVVALTVGDTGIGIAAEEIPKVFERFYRADPARTSDTGGTGLGLSIANWIASQHGGSIRLDSEPGRGTTATVRLPLES